jgi:multicomponent Na+:H+ antiporter subunit B
LKAFQIFLLAAFFGLLASTIPYLPGKGTADAPLHRAASPSEAPTPGNYFAAHAYEDAHTDNIVTVVLADYRGFDTLGETVVVFTAGVACVLILRQRRKNA